MPEARWPRVMLVTDRHRLVADTGAAAGDWAALLTAQIRGAVEGGADLIQVREPDLDPAILIRFLHALFASVPASQSRVVVNSQVHVARTTGARGVHLPERVPLPGDVRAPALADKQWVTGRSVHSVRSVADSKGVSYLLAGTVLPSRSKPDGWTPLGWEGLAGLVAAAHDIPVLAIGGLSAEHIPALVRSGATGIAGIGCFVPGRHGPLTEFVHDRVRAMRLAFDTPEVVSYTGEPHR
jgi:thiamine-phosphate pyrophosphorylase